MIFISRHEQKVQEEWLRKEGFQKSIEEEGKGQVRQIGLLAGFGSQPYSFIISSQHYLFILFIITSTNIAFPKSYHWMAS